MQQTDTAARSFSGARACGWKKNVTSGKGPDHALIVRQRTLDLSVMRTAISILLGDEAPRVLSVPMIAAALANRRKPVARGTLFKWIHSHVAAGALQPVTRGLYLNLLARPIPSVAEAAGIVRAGAIVSLQSVLGEAGITNNYSDIVTCVIPIHLGVAASSRPVRVDGAEFRFHAMPVRLLNAEAGAEEDRFDLDAPFARATPEKALLDWIYLGASPRTMLAGPPLDIDLPGLDAQRLTRLGIAMKLARNLEDYLARKRKYDRAPDVRANATSN